MDAEHLEYFKAALEGRATVGWNVWFAANQHALAQQLSRPALLRLKFSTLDEAERLLAEGEPEAGQAKLLAEFRRVRKRGLQQAHEWLADLCFEGEMELTSGNAEVGRSLLAVVVQAGSGHDLLDATAMMARELLERPD